MEEMRVTGTVTAYPNDEDKGLVEVEIAVLEKDKATIHARALQPCAGWYWLPEIGEQVEVLLSGIPGSEARLLGTRLPKDAQLVQACWTEKNDCKRIVSRAGCTLSFCDTDDKTSVRLETPGGLGLFLDDEGQKITLHDKEGKNALAIDAKNGEVTLCTDKKLALSCGGATFEIDSSGNITIHAKGTLKLSGRDIELAAQNGLKMEGQQSELKGKIKTAISGQTQLEVSSSGITQVKGSMVKLN